MHQSQHISADVKSIELHDKLLGFLTEKMGGAILRSQIDYDFPVFVVDKATIFQCLELLKNDQQTQFTFLTTMCGAHFPEGGDAEYMMMYQLHSLEKNERLRIKTFMSEKDMEMPTMIPLWAGANWMEREAFDFYGFKFKGHPDLRRILNMEEMDYHPLRKQYALEDGSRDDKKDLYFGR
jgi:NADH-quinone oxidoreductase subunit C